MKKIRTILTLGTILLLCGCKAHYPVAQQRGLEDVAYLLFVSPKEFASDYVRVTIDGRTHFEAKVVKSKHANRKGTSYSVAPGRRRVRVEHGGYVLYDREIMLSTQETQFIQLP